jgi:hypothetical protein
MENWLNDDHHALHCAIVLFQKNLHHTGALNLISQQAG